MRYLYDLATFADVIDEKYAGYNEQIFKVTTTGASRSVYLVVNRLNNRNCEGGTP